MRSCAAPAPGSQLPGTIGEASLQPVAPDDCSSPSILHTPPAATDSVLQMGSNHWLAFCNDAGIIHPTQRGCTQQDLQVGSPHWFSFIQGYHNDSEVGGAIVSRPHAARVHAAGPTTCAMSFTMVQNRIEAL